MGNQSTQNNTRACIRVSALRQLLSCLDLQGRQPSDAYFVLVLICHLHTVRCTTARGRVPRCLLAVGAVGGRTQKEGRLSAPCSPSPPILISISRKRLSPGIFFSDGGPLSRSRSRLATLRIACARPASPGRARGFGTRSRALLVSAGSFAHSFPARDW